MRYLSFLAAIHQRLEPNAYLEIGVRNGHSLALARCRAVGIDPAYSLTAELDGDVALFRTSSDDYFARPDPLQATGGRPFDLSFIDGLHLFEFAFRDFIYAERHSSARSVIIFDDVLPHTPNEASREIQRGSWTGDVYPILEVLARYRPELVVVPVATTPTGLLLVFGLDPANTVLVDNYDDIVAQYRHADPQPVPADLMDRLTIFPPQRVLEAGVLDTLNRLDPGAAPDQVRLAIADEVRTQWGSDFVAV